MVEQCGNSGVGPRVVEHAPQAMAQGVVEVSVREMRRHGDLEAVLQQRGSSVGVPTTCARCPGGAMALAPRELCRYQRLPQVLAVAANRREAGVKREDVRFTYPMEMSADVLGARAPEEVSHGVEVPGERTTTFGGHYRLASQVVHHGTAAGGHVRAIHMHDAAAGKGAACGGTLIDDERVSELTAAGVEHATVGGRGRSTTQVWLYVLEGQLPAADTADVARSAPPEGPAQPATSEPPMGMRPQPEPPADPHPEHSADPRAELPAGPERGFDNATGRHAHTTPPCWRCSRRQW